MSGRKGQEIKTRHSLFVSFLAICSVLGYECVSAAAFDEVTKPNIFRRGGAINTTVGLGRPKNSTEDGIMETSEDLVILFSDIDGTLVHYPTTDEREKGGRKESSNDNRILELPPSSTGMKGVISSKTLRQCQDVRRRGVKLVLVSGMRSSTLLKRLPYLPRADAYCCEAGGRIFYPIQQKEDAASLTVIPASYDGARTQDLEEFGLVEDMDWRNEMEKIDAAGKGGFVSNELGDGSNQAPLSIADREGSLWEFARRLLADGYVLDTKGYASCFRVNRNQQTPGVSKEAFDALSDGTIAFPSELSTSTNLGCVDFYPVASGKKNCCEYLANKFGGDGDGDGVEKNVLARQTVCLCDDDNDIEMARACLHAYVPSISSTSLSETIRSSPLQFTATCDADNNVEGTHATEAALALILERIAVAKAESRK